MDKKTSASQLKAVAKYQSDKVDPITFRVSKGIKQQLQSLAAANGENLSVYIKKAIQERYKKDTEKDIEL